MRAQYVVGCDGAHSTVRTAVGIEFAGKQYEAHILLADVQLERAPGDTLTGVFNGRGENRVRSIAARRTPRPTGY
nr:FAD-dependent monooxygenase [Mycolicibacterium malmesburyense]